ncbi:MAG: low molecular weight phosphotyrosine protein phosphatase [Gemmatimonadetes bacterium]|nr:MAG: low molecular weight phosphotyrosine protein phosphatase [Gemmatimonadota bacterium]
MTAPADYAVLFVCLGNICRSPLAEGVLRHRLAARGLDARVAVDSAGTGAWHVGEPADARSRAVARRHGVILDGRARRVDPSDFERFDLVLAMDRSNLADLEALRPPGEVRARLALFRAFDPLADGDLDVPDPYYGGPDGFERVYEIVERACEVLAHTIEEELDGPG